MYTLCAERRLVTSACPFTHTPFVLRGAWPRLPRLPSEPWLSTRATLDVLMEQFIQCVLRDAMLCCVRISAADADYVYIHVSMAICFLHMQVLEASVKAGGESIHTVVGKFRFLNEFIKMVSPKVRHDLW